MSKAQGNLISQFITPLKKQIRLAIN